MDLNFSYTYKCLWLLGPLLLFFFTDLTLWQVIAILVVYAAIMKLVQQIYMIENSIGYLPKIRLPAPRSPINYQFDHPEVSEGFEQCTNCQNPYFVQKFANIHNPSLIGQEEARPQIVEIPSVTSSNGLQLTPEQQQQLQKTLESDQVTTYPIPQPNTVQIEITNPLSPKVHSVEDDHKLSVCQSLKKAGFNPAWTHTDVKNLLKTPSGKQKIAQINRDVIKSSGVKKLTNQMIKKCYPNYINEYVCQRQEAPNGNSNGNGDTCKQTSQMIQLQKQIEQQAQKIRDLDNIIKLDSKVEDTSAIVDPRLQDQVINETTKPISDNNLSKYVNKNCRLDNIKKDIHVEVENFYGSAYEKISKQKPAIPPKQLQQIKMQYLNLTDIINNKALLEFTQLISFYQGQKNSRWQTDLLSRKTLSIRGHPVPGTDFYIPWTIFENNPKCFGTE
jgi:hypothetical protein